MVVENERSVETLGLRTERGGGTISNALALRADTAAVGEWTGAAARGLEARMERGRIIREVLIDGTDYGHMPGTPEDAKPVLYKPGAEKVTDALNLWPDYEAITIVEDFDRPLFFYRYRCTLRQRGTDVPVASGIGSCNSKEAKYRWRQAARVCPECRTEAIIKGKEEYGGGWLCFRKKGGCGATFTDGDEAIMAQTVGRVENDDIESQVNTIDKMGQKRALIAANLALGFSDAFTQDLEDGDEDERPAAPAKAKPKPAAKPAPAKPAAAKPAAAKPAPAEPPKQEIQQPKSKAEAALPANGTWHGTVAAVEPRTTKQSGRKFLIVRGGDGVEFVTFSESQMANAEAAVNAGPAVIEYETDKAGYRQIKRLDPEDEAPSMLEEPPTPDEPTGPEAAA